MLLDVRRERAEYGAFHDDTARGVDTALARDATSSENIVAGAHLDLDASTRAVGDGATDTLTEGILDTGDRDQDELAREEVVWNLGAIYNQLNYSMIKTKR